MGRNDDSDGSGILRLFLESFVIFGLIAGVPFLLGGVWPPFVSVVSDSMSPNMETGDLVYIVDNERFDGESVAAGISTLESNETQSFNRSGDVIIFQPDGQSSQTPVIHRAAFWVESGENWYERADEEYMTAQSCEALQNCPAPHDGFITIGDANGEYDQSADLSSPVKPEWIIGEAKYSVPYAGLVRLFLESLVSGISVDPVVAAP